MAIRSVGSSSSADALSVGAKAQPERAKLADAATYEGRPSKAGRVAATTASARVEAPKPVVNTQGQTTGRIINTKA